MTWLGLVVARRGARRASLAGWRMALLAAAGVFSASGSSGVWEAAIETLALVLVSRRRWRWRSASRSGSGPAAGPGRTRAAADPRCDADDPGVRVPAAVRAALRHRRPARADRDAGVRAAARDPADRARHPDGARDLARGGRLVRLHRAGSGCGSVQVPLAKPSIMLGVNQTIMMALGIVVIAAFVGAGGLGQTVLDGLQRLRRRRGAERRHRDRRHGDRARSRHDRVERPRTAARASPSGIAGRVVTRRHDDRRSRSLVTIAAVLIGREVLRQQAFPDRAGRCRVATPAERHRATGRQANLGDITSAVSDFVLIYLLDPIQDLFMGVPWWMVAGAFALIAWRVSGVRLAVGLFACIAALGLLGMWDFAMGTLSQVLVAVVHHDRVRDPARASWPRRATGSRRSRKPVLDAMQTMPAFVYLVPVLFLIEPGRVPAIIASFIYALPVGIRLTNLGIRAGARRRSSRRAARSARRRGSCCARCSCRSRGRRSCSASTRRS